MSELSINGGQKPQERGAASGELNRVKEKIMQAWEARVRSDIKSPSRPSAILRSMLPELLENLVSNISPNSSGETIDEAAQIGKKHGEQRAAFADYSFAQVLFEYRILRQVIFEVLEEENLQVSDVRDIILDVLDEGIENAVEQFSFIRSEELKRSNRDLEHFAAIAAHDLKSPLATIAGFAELLDENLQGKIEIEQTECIQAIKRSSARMTLLIDRLLEYSSVGRQKKVFENVSVHELIAGVQENLKNLIEKSKAAIHYDNLPTVFGDAALLSQVFQNFLSNSIKFSEPSRAPEIFISAEDDGRSWIFSIRDNGIGFDEKNKEEIFSLFKRLEVNNSKQPGSGIGLATARKVIELHGGTVWTESELGVGSTFFFSLPKSEELNIH